MIITAGPTRGPSERLEPDNAKVLSPVPRGLGGSNAPWLPDRAGKEERPKDKDESTLNKTIILPNELNIGRKTYCKPIQNRLIWWHILSTDKTSQIVGVS